MGVFTRPDSPYYWLHLDGRGIRERTKILIDPDGTMTGRRDARRLAGELFAARMTEFARADILDAHQRIEAQTRLRAEPIPLRRSLDGWCYIYFVQRGSDIKIGRASDVSKRLKALQTSSAKPLTLVAAIPAHADLEGAIQRKFAHLRQRGEWFQLAPELLAFIAAVKTGQNPVALLWNETPAR